MIIQNFQKEHENTLKEISTLETISNQIQGPDDFEKNIKELKKISEQFNQMLKHFESEEIVFDKLEEKGVKGPVDVMREEHDEMKEKEKEFNLMVNKKKLNKEEVKKFIYIIKYIAEMLKSHIQKEEMILYPLVIEKLSNEELKECGEKAEKLK